MKITKDTNIRDIIKKYPQLGTVLIEKYGLHCVGCIGALFETLEQGAKAHGMDEESLKEMIKDLNRKVSFRKNR